MTDFIDDLFNCIPEAYTVRDYKGYRQHREIFAVRIGRSENISFPLKTKWLFSLISSQDEETPENNIYFVVKTDGTRENVVLDSEDRITIAGKKHSNWICYR